MVIYILFCATEKLESFFVSKLLHNKTRVRASPATLSCALEESLMNVILGIVVVVVTKVLPEFVQTTRSNDECTSKIIIC